MHLSNENACASCHDHADGIIHIVSALTTDAGVDGGGSLRVPAALCGVVGLRPTVGRSDFTGSADNSISIMGFGPIAGSVSDAMIVYAAIANAGDALLAHMLLLRHTRIDSLQPPSNSIHNANILNDFCSMFLQDWTCHNTLAVE